MLIPICCERLPVRIGVSIKSAKGLPVMNKSISSTDAFVEVRFADDSEKTEVVTSLNPEWNSDEVTFDTDEKELSEEFLQFRVMDHDTYSANDAIGKVNVDCNILAESMRMRDLDVLEKEFTLPIYDTLNGIRGELCFHISIHLLIKYDYTNYVQIFSGYQIPRNHRVIEVIGLISDIKTEMDPDYEWLDRIRSPRATNEARQSVIREMLRAVPVSLAHKADKHQCHVIVGYQEHLDVEGSCSDLLTVRVYGTALRVVPITDTQTPVVENSLFPIYSINIVPHIKQVGIGSLVAARAIRILEEGEDAETVRKVWWNELRVELNHQCLALGCNLTIGYMEQMSINEGIALMACSGTAVNSENGPPVSYFSNNLDVHDQPPPFEFEKKAKTDREKKLEHFRQPINCSLFHTSLLPGKTNFPAKSHKCHMCKQKDVVDFLILTSNCPPPHYYAGPKNFIQVSVSRKISSEPNDKEDYAQELSNVLPFADHELFNSMIAEAKTVNPHANSIFEMRFTYAMSDEQLICVVTGILVRLLCIPPGDTATSPSLSNVLSFTSLQKYNEARRFSWGTVREAIRFKSSTIAPSVTLKILNLKPPMMESMDDSGTSSKGRLRLHTLVGKLKKRQHEKEYVSHVIFERSISTSIGFLDSQTAGNSNAIAGVHISPNLSSFVLSRDQMENSLILSRWSDVFVREDLNNLVKDSTTVDAFVTNALEERIAHLKMMATLGGQSVVSHLRLSCPQFTVAKEKAHMIILMSCDINSSETS